MENLIARKTALTAALQQALAEGREADARVIRMDIEDIETTIIRHS